MILIHRKSHNFPALGSRWSPEQDKLGSRRGLSLRWDVRGRCNQGIKAIKAADRRVIKVEMDFRSMPAPNEVEGSARSKPGQVRRGEVRSQGWRRQWRVDGRVISSRVWYCRCHYILASGVIKEQR
ncbi:hypothetical protein O3P69_000726 [Scylla paramamosain]|uniref:Uncharacterized protein n=1 Tax=Scylla paramamosain TaxID=85552 RepID=A0AAW0UVB8_SCYPA